jgi:hypothetical protein
MSEPETETERSLTAYLSENPLMDINTLVVEDKPVFLNDITSLLSNSNTRNPSQTALYHNGLL